MQKTESPSNPNRSEVDTGKSGVSLTDAEVICSFMHDPREPGYYGVWWTAEYAPATRETKFIPRGLTLDALWEVEGRLTEEQWELYRRLMLGYTETTMIRDRPSVEEKRLLHASAEAKIRALAATLRSRVLPKDDAEGTQAIQEKRDG